MKATARSMQRVPLVVAAALVVTAGSPATSVGQKVLAQEAPMSLTASDGTGLELVSLQAEAVIEDPLAFTELRLAFRNAEDRVREGRFRITLPPGATISRFAMRIGNQWQEGEVVELQAARVAYEDFLHRRQDPALLETEAGNEFSARVFPIPPRAVKELIVSYSQELPRTTDAYRLALRGLPRLGTLKIRGRLGRGETAAPPVWSVGGRQSRHEVIEVERRDWVPDRDFEILPPRAARRAGLRHDNLVVARVTPLPAGSAPARPLSSLAVLVDTSASRALGFGDQLDRLEALLAELGRQGDPHVTVTAFDQDVEPIFAGRARGFGAEARQRLAARRALGASDLGRALAGLPRGNTPARVLVMTDGVATAGETSGDKLKAAARALAAAGVQRLDVLAVGGIRDQDNLRRLAQAGLPESGLVLDAREPAASLVGRLTRATRSGLAVHVPGARWVWPATLDGVQPGDELLVYADLPADQAFEVTVAGTRAPLGNGGRLASTERPLLERAWVRARISRLLEQRDGAAAKDADMAEALRHQITQLSVRHRVLSPFTALLVLETEHDYARFNIDRRALADILTVDASGLTTARRPASPTAIAAAPSPVEISPTRESAALDQPLGSAVRRASAPSTPPPAEAKQRSAVAAAAPVAPMPKPDQGPAPAAEPAPPPPAAAPATAAAPPPAPRDTADRFAERDLERGAAASSRPAPSRRRAPRPRPPSVLAPGGAALADDEAPRRASVSPYEGPFAEVMALLKRGARQDALGRAFLWRDRDPGDVLALVAVGEAAESMSNAALAARAYGSIIDLFPGRADLRRFAGGRLERINDQRAGAPARALAVDAYRKAVEQRPDHPAGHRLLAFALLRTGRAAEAFSVLAAAVARTYPSGRFAGVDRILREDLGLAAAAWTRAEPRSTAAIRERLRQAGGVPEQEASLRFVLSWETDANDVDFHIRDGRGGHAYYANPRLASGGMLYADVTTGYGPECFTVRGPAARRAPPYRLEAHYYSRGPMGYGMGKLQIVEHDGQGGLRFEERPFVVMRDGAYVNLGTVSAGPGGAVLTTAR